MSDIMSISVILLARPKNAENGTFSAILNLPTAIPELLPLESVFPISKKISLPPLVYKYKQTVCKKLTKL